MKRIFWIFAVAVVPGCVAAPALADDGYTCMHSSSDERIDACTRFIARNPRVSGGYNNRGVGYKEKGDYNRAMADYDQAIRLDPKNTSAYSNRCGVYNLLKKYDRAMADCNQAILLDPTHKDAYNNRGIAWQGKGEYDRAIYDYDQAILLDPRDNRAYDNRGDAWSGKGEYDRAIYDYEQAILLDPKLANAYGDRGAAYEKKGDYARALADYDKSLSLAPDYAVAREGRIRLQTVVAAQSTPAPPQALLSAPLSPSGPAAMPVSAERRVALVIGNSAYRSGFLPALTNPAHDARLVAGALRQTGFETVELEDLDRDGMVKALRTFRAKADSADWALVYFAGHGIEMNRVNYLIPVDAKLADSGDVELEAVSYEAMLNAVGRARALRMIILDACRNSPFKARMHQTKALRSSFDRGLAPPPETEAGTLVVYSAKEGEAAVDGEGVNSPFAQAFVARLKTPGREVQRVFDDVRDDVLKATDKHQQPYKYGSLPGGRDFFFVAGK